MLALGWALFLVAFTGYSTVMGGIDGMPPLPKAYWPRQASELPPLPERPASRVVARLQQAFGAECPEIHRQIKLELASRGMVFAADHFKIEPDGRVCLTPLSVVMFSKDKGDPRPPEVTTIRGQVAFLRFDRPVTQYTEIGSRKIVAADLSGSIELTNNRRTPERADDLSVYIPTGPVYYSDEKKLIWSEDSVHLVDNQSRPRPSEVRGKGLEIELTPEAPAPKTPGTQAQARKQKSDGIGGIRRMTLKRAVDMHLVVREDSGFLANGAPPKPSSTPVKPGAEETALVVVKTPGPFTYLFRPEREGDLAIFEAGKAGGSVLPGDVTVTRLHEAKGTIDQIICSNLELVLRRKGGNGSASAGKSHDIDRARATGPEVVLTSDAEKLEARGEDFTYEATIARTTLKGAKGMTANLDGNLLKARALEVWQTKKGQAKPQGGGIEKMVAYGPGEITLHEKVPGKRPAMARWNEKLTSERDGKSDLLTLTGNAAFRDEQGDQSLEGQTLKVWMPSRSNPATPVAANAKPPMSMAAAPKPLPPQQAMPAPAGGSAIQGQGVRKLERLEALGSVRANSRELNIRDAARLMIWFKDGPPLPTKAGQVAPVSPTAGPSPVTGPAIANPATAVSLPMSTAPVPSNPLGIPGNSSAKEGNQPIDLASRSIEAWVIRSDSGNRLDRLRCEGSVVVLQEPAKPGEKGIDIRGETLNLTGSPNGHMLSVSGDLAQLRMDRILIVGPEVNIDQANNKAWVTGIGAMQMESSTNFQGGKLEKPVPLEVHWNKSMLFNGMYAEFHGGIQAEQQNSRLACQSLQVHFDKAISLKEGNKSGQPARVSHMVCDQRVRVEETVREGEKLVSHKRIVAVTLSMNKLEREIGDPAGKEGNEVRASGPGEFRSLQVGDIEAISSSPATPMPMGPEGQPVPAQAAKKEMKMLLVAFQGNMYGNDAIGTASFLENVRALHFPAEDPNLDISPDAPIRELPKGAYTLRCDRLEVLSRKEGTRTMRDLRARGRVTVRSMEFSGTADMVTFDESKNQVIFHGSETMPASLFRQLRPGAPPDEVKGRKITFNRATGQFRIDEGTWLGGS